MSSHQRQLMMCGLTSRSKRSKHSGVQDAEIRDECIDRPDSIANLQPLAGDLNQAKSDNGLVEWLQEVFAGDPGGEIAFRKNHYIPAISLELNDFVAFNEARRDLLKSALRRLIVA